MINLLKKLYPEFCQKLDTEKSRFNSHALVEVKNLKISLYTVSFKANIFNGNEAKSNAADKKLQRI